MNTEQVIKKFEYLLARVPEENVFFGCEKPELWGAALAALRTQQEREDPQPLTLTGIKKRINRPVYCGKNGFCGVVGFRRTPREDFCIGFSYGWEWLEDVWKANEGLIYDHEPKEAR